MSPKTKTSPLKPTEKAQAWFNDKAKSDKIAKAKDKTSWKNALVEKLSENIQNSPTPGLKGQFKASANKHMHLLLNSDTFREALPFPDSEITKEFRADVRAAIAAA